jgi:hypothetical protein
LDRLVLRYTYDVVNVCLAESVQEGENQAEQHPHLNHLDPSGHRQGARDTDQPEVEFINRTTIHTSIILRPVVTGRELEIPISLR